MNDDLNAAARRADREYREAEQAHGRAREDLPAPYLVTLMFFTADDAHKVVEQIKTHGGLFVSYTDDSVAPAKVTETSEVVHASVADFRRWGEKKPVYRSTLPGGKYQDGIASDGHPKYRERPEI